MRGAVPFSKLLIALASLILQTVPAARAEGIEVRAANLRAADEGVVLNAEFAFQLSPRLSEAVANGVPLYFVIEFDLTRPRWYWFDEKTASKRTQVRLSYHALSRQYRLSTGVVQQNFESLDEAIAVLRHVRNWLVVERGVTSSDARYEAAVRMRLDTGLLPRPLQVSALTSREWNLDSPWQRFAFRAPQQPPAPVETREQAEGRAQ
jgi:hypothetical protein